jgi:hypothetical protein
MQSAQALFDYYTSAIRLSTSPEEKALAKATWDAAYEDLPDDYKAEIRAILKQRVTLILDNQKALDERICIAGLSLSDNTITLTDTPA